MRSAVAGRHVLWRSQVSRSPTAACGGRSQRSSRIAAAACARRAPCEPFEAAPSFLCRGVTRLARPRVAHQLQISRYWQFEELPAIACDVCSRNAVDFGRRSSCARTPVGANGKLRRRNRAEQDYIAGQMAAPRKKNAKRGQAARGKHHPSADEPSPCSPTRRDPYAAHHRDARRAGSGLHLAVFCEPHFTWAAAAETLPQHSAQTTHS